MRLWTFMTPTAWLALQKDGVLANQWKFADRDFTKAYEWVSRKMGISHPPIWAWPEKPSKSIPYMVKAGQFDGYVLVEFEKPESETLVTDYDTWHTILNNGYVPTREEDEEFEYLSDSDDPELRDMADKMWEAWDQDQKKKEASWDRVVERDPLMWSSWSKKGSGMQVTVPDVRLSEVISHKTVSNPALARRQSWSDEPIRFEDRLDEILAHEER